VTYTAVEAAGRARSAPVQIDRKKFLQIDGSNRGRDSNPRPIAAVRGYYGAFETGETLEQKGGGTALMLGALTLGRLASKYDAPGWSVGI
jgi:hypothetical protein